MIDRISDMAAAYERAKDRQGRLKREAMGCGCLDGCQLLEYGMPSQYAPARLIHRALDGTDTDYEYDIILRHWSETTMLPTEVHDWLRSLHPVFDTLVSEKGTEPEVWAIMRGEA